MNAIRIRKENQVYTALEKKALALIQLEENKQKVRHHLPPRVTPTLTPSPPIRERQTLRLRS